MSATVSVPLPVGYGYCIEHKANVDIDARGRCPIHLTLAIWRDDEPRPDIATERMVKLLEIARVDRSPKVTPFRKPPGGQTGARPSQLRSVPLFEEASDVTPSGESPHPSDNGGSGSWNGREPRLDLAPSQRAIAGSRAASSVLPEAARPHLNTTSDNERPL